MTPASVLCSMLLAIGSTASACSCGISKQTLVPSKPLLPCLSLKNILREKCSSSLNAFQNPSAAPNPCGVVQPSCGCQNSPLQYNYPPTAQSYPYSIQPGVAATYNPLYASTPYGSPLPNPYQPFCGTEKLNYPCTSLSNEISSNFCQNSCTDRNHQAGSCGCGCRQCGAESGNCAKTVCDCGDRNCQPGSQDYQNPSCQRCQSTNYGHGTPVQSCCCSKNGYCCGKTENTCCCCNSKCNTCCSSGALRGGGCRCNNCLRTGTDCQCMSDNCISNKCCCTNCNSNNSMSNKCSCNNNCMCNKCSCNCGGNNCVSTGCLCNGGCNNNYKNSCSQSDNREKGSVFSGNIKLPFFRGSLNLG